MAKRKADDTPEAPAAEAGQKMKKSDAMREAIKRGIDKPIAASEFIKSEFGLDVTPQVFSSFKSISKKKEGETSPVRARRARQAAEVLATPNGQRVGNRNPAELAKQVKELVAQFGAGTVKSMVEVFE